MGREQRQGQGGGRFMFTYFQMNSSTLQMLAIRDASHTLPTRNDPNVEYNARVPLKKSFPSQRKSQAIQFVKTSAM